MHHATERPPNPLRTAHVKLGPASSAPSSPQHKTTKALIGHPSEERDQSGTESYPKTMPRILNRPPVFPKPRDKVSSFLITTSSTKGSSSVRSSSGLSRSERSDLLSHGGGNTSSIRSVRSDHSQLTFDTSMSNAAYDGASGRVQNNDWGHFVDFYDPQSRDDDVCSFSLWRS